MLSLLLSKEFITRHTGNKKYIPFNFFNATKFARRGDRVPKSPYSSKKLTAYGKSPTIEYERYSVPDRLSGTNLNSSRKYIR